MSIVASPALPAPKRRSPPVSPIKSGQRDGRLLALVAKGLDHVEIAAALRCRSSAVRVRLRVLRDAGLV